MGEGEGGGGSESGSGGKSMGGGGGGIRDEGGEKMKSRLDGTRSGNPLVLG